MANLDTRVVYINPFMCRLLGYSSENIVGKPLLEFVAPARRDKLERELLPVVLKEGQWTGETAVANIQGGSTSALQSIFVISDDEGKPVRLATTLIDLTQVKLAQEAMRQSEEKYRSLVEASPNAVLMLDLERNITYASQQLAELFGYDAVEELCKRPVTCLVAAEERQRLTSNLSLLLQQGVRRNMEYTGVRRDGARFVGEVSSAVIRDDKGEPRAFMGVIRDATDRRRAEEALQREHRTLKHLLESSDHERQLIAYEIHDELAQQLAGAIMQFQTFGHLKDEKPGLAAKAYDAGTTMLQQGAF